MRVEAFAVGGADVIIGAGPGRARRAGAELAASLDERTAVALVGVAGGLSPELRPGDLVIASELRDTESSASLDLPGASFLAAEFRRAGLGVHTGPLVSRRGMCAPGSGPRSPPRALSPSTWSRPG